MSENHIPDTTSRRVRDILNAEIRMATIGVNSVEACLERIKQLEKQLEQEKELNGRNR